MGFINVVISGRHESEAPRIRGLDPSSPHAAMRHRISVQRENVEQSRRRSGPPVSIRQ